MCGLSHRSKGVLVNINNAILHVFDFVSCVNVFAQAPMDLGNKAA